MTACDGGSAIQPPAIGYAGHDMKIVAQKVFVANVSRTNFVFVKLYTDDGIEGVGEATLEWKTKTVVAALEELERFLVGRDPFATETLQFENGELLAPTAPGLGVELIEEACARYPYAPFDVPLFDGSMNTKGVAAGAETMSTSGTATEVPSCQAAAYAVDSL